MNKQRWSESAMYTLIGFVVLFFFWAIIADQEVPDPFQEYIFDSNNISEGQVRRLDNAFNDGRLSFSELIKVLFGG
jgi:hypothetical protein